MNPGRTALLLLVVLSLIDVQFGRALRAAEVAPKIDPRYARIESEMLQRFASVPAEQNALTIGIVEHGELAWTASYGVADFRSKTVPNSRTLYHIASVTKVVTGIMLLQLVERGVVHLTDPVERYVPEFKKIPNPYPWSPPVTLMQLATMTSGLDDKSGPNCPAGTKWDVCLLSGFSSMAYASEPGTQRSYCNSGYAVLGLALSRAVHRPYSEYVVAEIFRPLDMRDSTFSVEPLAASRIAQPAPDMPRVQSTVDGAWIAAAGVITTVEDLAKLMRFQLGMGPESVLSHKALESSYRLVVPSDADLRYGDGVGYAASRNADGNLAALGHGGSSRYITSYEFDRSAKSGIIVLTSDQTSNYKALVREALKILNPTSLGGSGLQPLERH
jgi:CubicO group peptidase (beta-lactamase class C family)